MSKLWTQSDKLNPAVEAYTVGEDYIYDMKLLPYDLQASSAHAKMLQKIGILSEDEYQKIDTALAEIKKLYDDGKFQIKPEQEDCHTAIEQYITEKHGEAGKKIHTGRSRNDQALAMTRLYMKDVLEQAAELLKVLAKKYDAQAKTYQDLPMPGYTHMQKAMPSTVGAWFGAYRDAFEDLIPLNDAVFGLVDQNPLGSAAGFGIKGIDIDREATAEELGFSRIQENPLYCGLSRGFFELAVVQQMSLISSLAARFASDMMLFTTSEFGYFALPGEYTTGSSIMPNKHNYDLFEIMRGNSGLVGGAQTQIQTIISGLGSGFHRDLQLSKGPFIRAAGITLSTLEILIETIPEIIVSEPKLKNAMSDDLYATEQVYKLVGSGMAFRDAYQQVKNNLKTKEQDK